MRIAAVATEKLPVPPVLGGAIEHTLFETAETIDGLEFLVVSPWRKELENKVFTSNYHHVDIGAQRRRFEQTLGKVLYDRISPLKNVRSFAYMMGVRERVCELRPDLVQVHNRPAVAEFLVREFPRLPVVLYMH